jgi:hypothetical protein
MCPLRSITLLAVVIAFASGEVAAHSNSIVSGNRQFHVSPSFPADFADPLGVRVADESGRPVAGAVVRFAISSPGGGIVADGGSTREAVTDDAGIASWPRLKGLSGRGFFNVTADTDPPTGWPATFLLSQNPSAECLLPSFPIATSTELIVSPRQDADGAPVELTAIARYASGSLPVPEGALGVMDGDRLVLAGNVPTDARTGTLRGVVNLPPGAHFLRARYLDSCVFRRSESSIVPHAVNAGVVASMSYSDMWWKPTESGWGLSLIQHASGQLFVVWFHYADSGSPQWLVIPGGTWTTPTSFTGAIYRTTGPALGGVFDPSRVTVVPIGVATLAFTDAERGTFTWWFDGGSQGAKSITRQPF